MSAKAVSLQGGAPGSSGLRLSVGQFSCAGCKPVNQDSMAARLPQGLEANFKGAAFAVADGISSSAVSQVAAETAVKALVTDYYATPQAWTAQTSVARVVQATNSWLYAQNRAQRTSDLNQGLVCTLSALVVKGREAHVFHVGDSRISRLQRSGLEPLTQDHTTVLSDSQHYLGRALGIGHRVDIDYLAVPTAAGDIFLLTTDGIHDFVDDASICSYLRAGAELTDVARQIAWAALEAGSTDNLTVQLVRIDQLTEISSSYLVPDLGLPIPSTLRPGGRLDQFELLREVHHSSRSQLMLATDAAGELVALKIPVAESSENEAYLQRFLFEEWIARRVDSPHVVKAASAEGRRSASYVAMQWVQGTTLRQWMTDHPEPEIESVRAIAEQVARGLRALHRQEMIHQDLRPENVMIDDRGVVTIIDLGSVAVAGVEQAAPGLLGSLPGTYQYTAPEYLSGDQVSWRSDQYALATIVYEMLTGRLPYGAQVARVRNRRDQRQLKYQPADLGDRAVPAWIDHALARACHRDPVRRYDALSDLLVDLRAPASDFRPRASRPLLERNPLRFWQSLALAQTLLLIYLASLWPGSG
ncbi:MAG: protein kinase [Pseudomonadales bacterium]